ncbi:hypothetical protein [Roseateles sp. MS654]|uniref:hypothetical protein n=1 Tax=Roseateles sp. MS654 TaxID=3412685 RepID=UPI003C2FE93F
MTHPASVSTFIAEQRELLVRLERFARTAEFRRLQAVGPQVAGDGAEVWLSLVDSCRLWELTERVDVVLRTATMLDRSVRLGT